MGTTRRYDMNEVHFAVVEKLKLLYDAVDDYLYSGEGYPEGHTNPRFLEALRQAFLDASASDSGLAAQPGFYEEVSKFPD